MTNFWKLGAMAWCLSVLGWFLSPIISLLLNKLFCYFSFDASRRLRELEIHTIPMLKKTLGDVEEQRMLRAFEDKRSESDLKLLDKMKKDLKFALYEAEDILDLIDYHRIQKSLIEDGKPSPKRRILHTIRPCITRCKRSWFGERMYITQTALLWGMQRLIQLGWSLCAILCRPVHILPLSQSDSISMVQRLYNWLKHLILDISNYCQSMLLWLTGMIVTVRSYRDWSYEYGIRSNQMDPIALDFFLTHDKKSLRERIEQIEYVVTDSNKSQLLNQQSSGSRKILIKDTNKESCSKQDIDDLYRSITRKVFGRDKERDHICRMLRDGPDPYGPSSRSSKHYSVIGIHGIAGSGKSTLAKYVCDYEKGEGNHFDLVVFIHVSTSFRLGDIFRNMLEQMKPNQPSDDRGLKSLQVELKENLKGRCFLLVLDDVWVNDCSSKEKAILFDVLDSGKTGSGILVTAQKIDAARALGAEKLIAISDLEEEQYFSMFMHHVALQGTYPIDDREHIVIGRKITKKLHKSPIAAVTVAARLGMKPDINFWETTANLDVLNKTMGALWWSYQQLGADIRRCFEYCSIFPRGYRLGRDELVRIWIAQGLVNTSSGTDDMVDLAQCYFDELLTFSFLQVQRTIIDTELYTIHDLLHELADRVAGGDFFRMDVNRSPKDIPPEVHHLFIATNNRANITEKILDLANLRTLVIMEERDTNMNEISMALWNHKENHDLVNEKVFASMFMRLRKLRVLIVKIEHYDKLVFSVPASIGQMKHLRYLSFPSTSHVELIFPNKFRKLYHIQVLEVSAFKLSHAEDMANLIHLRYVSARQNLPNIHKLTLLNTIRCFRVQKEQEYKLNQLMDLNNLRGSLDINGLENVESKEEALQARLAQKKQLKSLSLKFSMHSSNPDVEVEVLEGLCPPEHLEQLSIWFYSCSSYPSWMLGRQNRDTPKHLYRLALYRCSKLVSIPENSDFFIHLRKLHLSWCSWDALPDHMQRLTSLQELAIYECNEMKLLPVLPLSLEHITITGNYMLRTSCQERGHINWQKVQHIPKKRFS